MSHLEREPALVQKTRHVLIQLRLPKPLLSLFNLLVGQGAQQGYLATVDQALISLSNFLATLILARNASLTELGVYGVGFTTLRLVRTIQEGLTIQPMNTFGAGMDEDEFRAYATHTSLLQILLAVCSAAVVAVAGSILTRLGNDTAGPLLFSLWSAFLWWQLQEYIRRLLYTRGKVFQAAANTALANLVRLLLMVWWVEQGQLTGAAGVQAISLGSLVALLPGLWQTRRYWTRQLGKIGETWKRNWDFGRWVLGGMVANWLAVEFYPVLTAGLVSFATAGVYRALQNVVAPIHLLLRAADTFLTPRTARSFQQKGLAALERTLRLAYLVAGLPIMAILLLALLFPGPLLSFLYGDEYTTYSQGMALMALFYALLFAYSPLQTMLKAARFSRPIFVANLVAILAMFSVGIWMIQRWGIYGTLGGQILNSLIVAVALWGAWFRLKRSLQ
ncbi:MAG: hypothetical protein JXB15_04590 [Anaerolineales bacterium]|nr:hypothetical protein [Anaerolineales bacterium]